METKIAVIGAGSIGAALGEILKKRNGLEVEFWDSDQSKMPVWKPVADVVAGAEFIFLCVPSWELRNAAEEISPHLASGAVVVSLTKGLEEKTLKTADEVLKEVLPKDSVMCILGGPMLSGELKKGNIGVAVAAIKNEIEFLKIKNLLSGMNVFLEYSNDVHGVALVGVLKNVYAFGLGVIDALELGNNFKGWWVQKSLQEMARMISDLGGNGKTALDVAGLGDLVATGFSNNSKNFRSGQEFVKTGKCLLKGEGFVSLPLVFELLKKDFKNYPLLVSLRSIVIDCAEPKGRLLDLIKNNLLLTTRIRSGRVC